jgi:hypothetical protein
LTDNSRLFPIRKSKVNRWDFVRAFKPPEYLSIENGRIFKLEVMQPNGSPDYKFVVDRFNSTFAQARHGMFNPVAPVRMPPPGLFGGGAGG